MGPRSGSATDHTYPVHCSVRVGTIVLPQWSSMSGRDNTRLAELTNDAVAVSRTLSDCLDNLWRGLQIQRPTYIQVLYICQIYATPRILPHIADYPTQSTCPILSTFAT